MSEEAKQDPKLKYAQQKFLCQSKDLAGVDHDKVQEELLQALLKDDLSFLYEQTCTDLGLQIDAERLAAMKQRNTAHMEELDVKLKDAEENLGETEVRDALLAKAEYLATIGDRAGAAQAYKLTEEKTTGSGNKVDYGLSMIRLHMFYGEWHTIKDLLAKVQTLCDDGGDWERKNKLKVYQGVFAMFTRDFKRAAQLLLDSVATFTTSELFVYERVILYAVICSVLALERPQLKAKVIESPEVLSVIGGLGQLGPFINSLYGCKYKDLFKAFIDVVDQMRADMFLSAHVRYYMREVRVVVYTQFLESYKSVTLESMAAALDVSVPFLDADLADFIVAGRINAKIDKVAGVVETNRPDAKNALYADVIRKGDLLLNHVQKLSRVIDIE